ncbi:MAG: hypothetical protein JSC189_000087 [Candidatus Tokpelaia sp. JSC189]|nr:MAG: hypothetical protein JSC189_000087 [Candidatus Tokpelaia sp. JSC189]
MKMLCALSVLMVVTRRRILKENLENQVFGNDSTELKEIVLNL